MDDKGFEDTVARLKRINAVVEELDSAIRAAGFEVLKPYVTTSAPSSNPGGDGESGSGNDPQRTADTGSAEAFVRSQPLDKPSQAVAAIAAWWFGEYGSAPIKRENVEQIAAEIGVTVSSRPDKTLIAMKTDGKPVFRSAGRGKLVPTVPHGELYFAKEFNVTKGKKTPPSADDA